VEEHTIGFLESESDPWLSEIAQQKRSYPVGNILLFELVQVVTFQQSEYILSSA
jgi:hypothetical protein